MEQYHTVAQGEYLSSIAKQYNISNYKQILDHPRNSEIRLTRPDPNVLYPGDRLFIPEMEIRYEQGATEQRHLFVARRPKQLLRVVVKDFENKCLANEEYTLKVISPEEKELLFQGQTDHQGLVQQEIPIGTEYGELQIKRLGYFWALQIGHLDPVENNRQTISSGVLARLANLGYGSGAADEDQDLNLKVAVKEFQEEVLGRVNASGELDDETLRSLLKEHGC